MAPLTVFGVVVPMWFLARDDATPPGWHETLTLVGFFVGLTLVLLYIAYATFVLPLVRSEQIRQLRDQAAADLAAMETSGDGSGPGSGDNHGASDSASTLPDRRASSGE